MQNNEFLVFGGGVSASVMDQAAYAALPARVSGFQSGLAQSRQLNKVWRQSSIMAAVLAQFIADLSGQDALDDGTTAMLLANLKAAVPVAVNAVGVNTSKRLNGVNSPNLLFNGSGEFGNAGWGSSIFASKLGSFGEGTYFINSSAISSDVNDLSLPISIGANVSLTLSAEIYAAGVSSGNAFVYARAHDVNGNFLGWVAEAFATRGADWTYYSGSGVTPPNTAYVIVVKVIDTSPSVNANGLGFRRIKLEKGSTPSLYSQEASIAAAPGSVIGTARNLRATCPMNATSITFTADQLVVGSALSGPSYMLSNFNKTLNLGITGAGGMDAGAATAGGWLAVYAIYNPTTSTAALLGAMETTAATSVYNGANMPAGYIASALLAVLPMSNAAGQLKGGLVNGRRISVPQLLTLQTSTPQATPIGFSLAGAVPKAAVRVSGMTHLFSTTTSQIGMSLMCDGVQSLGYQNVSGSGGSASTGNWAVDILAQQTLYYTFVNSAGTPTMSLYISGYEI